MQFTGKHFLKLLDFSPAEIDRLLHLAAELKAEKKAGTMHDCLRGKNIALIFEKTSTRTRCIGKIWRTDMDIIAKISEELGIKRHQTCLLYTSTCDRCDCQRGECDGGSGDRKGKTVGETKTAHEDHACDDQIA